MEGITIARYSDIHPPELGGLLDASLAERHGLVRRTLEDWTDGINQFDQPGEAFFLATLDMTTVGMCGLNVDPFIDDHKVGRVRHLYVLPEFRRQNIGRRLVEACLAEAEGVFERVRLRTFDPSAAHFYEAFGFTATNEDAATHTLNLATSPRKLGVDMDGFVTFGSGDCDGLGKRRVPQPCVYLYAPLDEI